MNNALNGIWGANYKRGDNAAKTNDQGRLVQQHHLMLLITDANSEEVYNGAQAFRSLIERFDVTMSLLVVNKSRSPEFVQTCKTLANSDKLLAMIDPRLAGTMQTAIAGLLLNMFTEIKADYRIRTAGVPQIPSATAHHAVPLLRDCFVHNMLPWQMTPMKQRGATHWSKRTTSWQNS